MKIDVSGVQSKEAVDKALTGSLGNAFEMEDITGGIERKEVEPKLLTSMFLGEFDSYHAQTNVIRFDEVFETMQLPNGKAYQDYGKDLQKDKPRQHLFEVPSFGLRGNVAPRDYMGKRIPNTGELMDEAYLINRIGAKMNKAWDAFKEVQIAKLITGDTYDVFGGPTTAYNYYLQILGGARPAARDMLLGTATNVWQDFSNERDLLDEELDKTGNSASDYVVICGTTFFNKRLEIEQQASLARPFVAGIDMQTTAVPTVSAGGGSNFRYQNFRSVIDGLLYVRYSASIQGAKLIADADAYMIPQGCENLFRMAFAPAETRQYVNTEALEMYSWSHINDRTGITVATESNVLPMLVAPSLIRHLTTSN
jgi:hypothetical protein